MREMRLLGILLLGVTVASLTGMAGEENEQILSLKSQVFGNTRKLRVLLPPEYFDPAHKDKTFPVCYFTDGIAAWDAWGLTGVAAQLWQKNQIDQVIFVAIDNGGSTQEATHPVRDRAREYLPYPDQTWAQDPPEAEGKRFPQFLFEEVMPLINRRFRTQTEAAATGLAGSSYGGAVALYTAMHHPGRIGVLLLESPSLHIGERRLLADAGVVSRWPAKVYLGAGTAEGDTPEAQSEMVDNVSRLRALLEKAATAPRLRVLIKEGGTHWYDAWRERLPSALRFLFGPAH